MRWSKRKVAEHGYLVKNVGIGQSGLDAYVVAYLDANAWHSPLDNGAGYDRVRDSRRGARGHRDLGNHGVSAEVAGALERDCRRYQRLVGRLFGREGQATVEFAVVTAGFLAITVTLVAFWNMLDSGLIVEHALAVASHHIQLVAPAAVADIFLY